MIFVTKQAQLKCYYIFVTFFEKNYQKKALHLIDKLTLLRCGSGRANHEPFQVCCRFNH